MADVDRTAVAWRLAAELARARGENQAAAAVARGAAALAGAEVARVWMIDRNQGYRFSGAWPEQGNEDASVPGEVPRAIVFAAPLAGKAKAPFRSRLVIPLMAGQKPMGAVELLEKTRSGGAFTKEDAAALNEMTVAADSALEAVKASSSRERGQLEAITRLTRLFDVGRTFTATLDLDALKQLIVNRVRAVLEVENVYLWLLDEDRDRGTLEVAAAAGPAAEAVAGWTIPADDNLAGHVVGSNQGYIVEDVEEIDGWETRQDAQAGLAFTSLAAAPVAFEDEAPIGAIEVINKENGLVLDRDDLAFLSEAAATAALALGNARRIDAERRASDLGALLDTAQELSSSLDVQKVSFILVHKAAAVLPYKRASLGLLRGGRLELTAVSGATFVDDKLPEMKALREILSWANGMDEGLYVVREEDGSIDAARPETREKFKVWFEQYGGRTFLTVPLKDDEGKLGIFAMESDEPMAFSGHALEAAQLLAVQASVAIRNATLYQQVPMVRMFQPIAKGQRRFQSLTGGRRVGTIVGAVAVLAALFLPWPLRVAGDARVLPQRKLPVTSAVEGRIAQILVREGDKVGEGQVLAKLDDTDIAAGREAAQARYQSGVRELGRLRAEGLTGDAAVQAARLEGLKAEVDLWNARQGHTELRATSAGIVATPRIEELVGTRLVKGDTFCEVVEPGRQEIEVAIPERDAGLVGVGQKVTTKLYAFPTKSFPAVVEQLGVAATVQEGGNRVFLARARLTRDDDPLRPGMTGRAKITTRWTFLARVALRRPARWIWNIVWGWLP